MDKLKQALILMLGLFLLGVLPAAAQSDVYVTTQDFVSLRAGPAERFERYTVIDPAVTLPAVGRTADMQWVQVDYNGQLGWISALYLVWSGDIVQLPVDGLNREPFVRRAIAWGTTFRDTPIYRYGVDSSERVGTLPPETEVEVTARVGEGEYFWLQIRYEGEQYWVGSWDIWLTGGTYVPLIDASYRYPYGRLLNQLRHDVDRSVNSLSSIETIWIRLGSGESVSCEIVPLYAVRVAVDTDLTREPIFAPVAEALDSAITDLNLAISTFADACAFPDDQELLTEQDVRASLTLVASARRNLVLADALLNSLRNHDPLLSWP